jgi:PKHD-type hydroxylase
MFLKVPDFLIPPEVQALREVAAQGTFVGGKASAGSAGEDIKRNEELKFTPDQVALVNKLLQSATQRSKYVQFFAWPRRVQTPFISRYGTGMGYGGHFDNPIMFSRDELETAVGSQSFKLPAGHAFVYSTTMYHRVAPVTRGTRLAAVTWIQSLIKEPDRRQILWDLAQARQAIQTNRPQGGKRLHQAFSNLIKLWSEV